MMSERNAITIRRDRLVTRICTCGFNRNILLSKVVLIYSPPYVSSDKEGEWNMLRQSKIVRSKRCYSKGYGELKVEVRWSKSGIPLASVPSH